MDADFQSVINEIDEDGNGEVSFDEFATLVARFVHEEEQDTAAIQLELKGAFRFYDKEGMTVFGFTLRALDFAYVLVYFQEMVLLPLMCSKKF